ncbi:hypothetical protein NMY22_g15949 [Coprinellus aureogranulatus]|nr:hypothetical protein NMY22_g15949 [Coprinellus aureogranulatus]
MQPRSDYRGDVVPHIPVSDRSSIAPLSSPFVQIARSIRKPRRHHKDLQYSISSLLMSMFTRALRADAIAASRPPTSSEGNSWRSWWVGGGAGGSARNEMRIREGRQYRERLDGWDMGNNTPNWRPQGTGLVIGLHLRPESFA